MDDVIKFEHYKSEKEPGSFSKPKKKMRRYVTKILLIFIILNQVVIQLKKVKD